MLLERKNAVIYGGSGAIGGAVARAFAGEGASVFLASRSLEGLHAVADGIASAGGSARVAQVDATDERAVERHIADVEAEAGSIDILFNAIGMDDVQGTPLIDMSPEDVVRPVIKATRTQFVTARAAARRMVNRGSGVILTITVAPSPEPLHGGFGVACAAIEGLWRTFATELGPHGVRFVGIRSAGSPDAPGVQETFEHHAEAAGVSPEAFLTQAGSGTLLKRLPLLAEVASVATLMASDRASAMTGAFANATCGSWVDV
jgi:3-oxoacyl-[acyl-carrier protein] reductase